MKERKFNLSLIKELTLYTGTNGKRGCSCNCPGCSQTNYGERKSNISYHGTLEQIKTIIELLPNLEKAYFLGNPDCSIDASFCSDAAKLFIDKGIHVMFSTSGIGGKNIMKTLLNNLDLNFVDYVSFSIDSIDPIKESILKGQKIDYDMLLDGINYCKSLKVPIKIQPTIWQINQNECVDLIDFFSAKYDINWFTFHVGSEEGFYPNKVEACKHVLPNEWHDISHQILEYSIKSHTHTYVPLIFLNTIEYENYMKNYLPHCINNNPTNIQIWMEDNLKATFYPILSNIYPHQFIDTFDADMISTQIDLPTHLCIAQNFSLGKELASEFNGNVWEKNGQKLFYVCRYYKQIV